jgi:hypothetical protein
MGRVLMKIEENIPLLEEILEAWKPIIGAAYQGYKNHVYRMVNFCFALHACSQEEREKIIIAGCFHDIGIWIENTVDYIPPSIPPAKEYLKRRNLEPWSAEIELMISEHHKIKAFKNDAYPLVELFRRGDLVDFSFGLFKFGLPKDYIDRVKTQFPNAGFHANLGHLAAKWFVKHPFNPAPMMKW